MWVMFHSPNQKKTVFYKRKKKEKEKKGLVLVTLLYFLNFEWDISTYFFNYITVMCPDIWFIIFQLSFDDSNYSNSIDYYFNALSN